MKTYKKIKKKIIEKKIQSITCNGCGKKVEGEYSEMSKIESFSHTFGYGSKRDGDKVEFDLCEKCVDRIFKQFKIQPITKKIY